MKQLWWFCVCAPDECSAYAIGPFFEESEARKEANIGCDNAHFIVPFRGEYSEALKKSHALRAQRDKRYADMDDHPEKYLNASIENLIKEREQDNAHLGA